MKNISIHLLLALISFAFISTSKAQDNPLPIPVSTSTSIIFGSLQQKVLEQYSGPDKAMNEFFLYQFTNFPPVTVARIQNHSFYLSRVIGPHNFEDERLYVIAYHMDEDGKIRLRHFFKSQSSGGWRSLPGTGFYPESKNVYYIKGNHIHYTQETKVQEELAKTLQGLEKIKTHWPEKSKDDDFLVKLHSGVYDREELIKYQHYTYDNEVHAYEVDELAPIQTSDLAPGAHFPDNIEFQLSRIALKSPSITARFWPDFKRPIRNYQMSHTLLSSKNSDEESETDIAIEVFEGVMPDGRIAEWHFAQDPEGRIWIDRIQFKDCAINSYGVCSEVIDSGPLTHKPLEYEHQIGPDYHRGRVKSFKDQTMYVDISSLLELMPPIAAYKKLLAERKEKQIVSVISSMNQLTIDDRKHQECP